MVMNALKHEPIDATSPTRVVKKVCRRPDKLDLPRKTVQKSTSFPSQPNPYDIVCERDGLGVIYLSKDRQHTGNHRLKVLLDMRKVRYVSSDREVKQRIVAGLVSAIIDDALGCFLEVDKPSGKFTPVSRELATSCVALALDADSATDGEKRQFGQSEVKKMVLRKHKKALLDRHENRVGKENQAAMFSQSLPPTTLSAFRGVIPKAA